MCDPWVKTASDPQHKLSDAVAELNYAAVNGRKTIALLYWWFVTLEDPQPNTAANFAESFDLIKDDVDGIGGWNFSGSYVDEEGRREERRLDTYTADPVVPKLWTEIGTKNDSV